MVKGRGRHREISPVEPVLRTRRAAAPIARPGGARRYPGGKWLFVFWWGQCSEHAPFCVFSAVFLSVLRVRVRVRQGRNRPPVIYERRLEKDMALYDKVDTSLHFADREKKVVDYWN